MGEQVVAIHDRLLNRQRDIFNECLFFSRGEPTREGEP
jgi:hypothetical protein